MVRSGKMVLRHSELNAKTKGIKLVLVHQNLLKTPAVYSWNIRLFTNRHAAARIDDRKTTTTFHLLKPQFPTIYSSKFHTSRSFYHRLVMSFQCWADWTMTIQFCNSLFGVSRRHQTPSILVIHVYTYIYIYKHCYMYSMFIFIYNCYMYSIQSVGTFPVLSPSESFKAA